MIRKVTYNNGKTEVKGDEGCIVVLENLEISEAFIMALKHNADFDAINMSHKDIVDMDNYLIYGKYRSILQFIKTANEKGIKKYIGRELDDNDFKKIIGVLFVEYNINKDLGLLREYGTDGYIAAILNSTIEINCNDKEIKSLLLESIEPESFSLDEFLLCLEYYV